MLGILSHAYAWTVAHGPEIAGFLVLVLPTVITGLSKYPRAGDGLIGLLKVALSLASVVVHADSPGTFKAPLVLPERPLPPPLFPTYSSSGPPRGFARIGLLAALGATAAILCSAPAFAEDPPGPAPQRLVGGCNAKGTICFGPSIAIAMTAYDLTHKRVIGSLAPGLGYGVTFNQGKWDAFGFDFYLSMTTGPQEGITFAGLFKFANGYVRVGIARQILTDGPTSTFIPAGIGVDF